MAIHLFFSNKDSRALGTKGTKGKKLSLGIIQKELILIKNLEYCSNVSLSPYIENTMSPLLKTMRMYSQFNFRHIKS